MENVLNSALEYTGKLGIVEVINDMEEHKDVFSNGYIPSIIVHPHNKKILSIACFDYNGHMYYDKNPYGFYGACRCATIEEARFIIDYIYSLPAIEGIKPLKKRVKNRLTKF